MAVTALVACSGAEEPADDALPNDASVDDSAAGGAEGVEPSSTASTSANLPAAGPPTTSGAAQPTSPSQVNTGGSNGEDGAGGSGAATPPSPQPSSPGPSETSSAEPAPDATAPSNSAPRPPAMPSTDDSSSIAPGSGPLGLETTCDGVDDDLNGVIDDVDAAGDGICDCLAVATLGLHGDWGGGDVFESWFTERSTTAVQSLGDAELTAELLAPFQVLIVRDVSPMNNAGLSYSAAEAEVLRSWVRDGGGLMTVIGYSSATEITNVNALLNAYALSYGTEPILSGGGAPVPITEWVEHALTSGLSAVGADNGYPVAGQGTTIASEGGYELGKAAVIGDGHVLVWGDELVTYEDEWRDNAAYQVDVFWLNVFDWLARANECHVPRP